MTKFAIIDLETTGLDPETARICEISCMQAKLTVTKLFREIQHTWLVNPGILIPPETSAIHQICDEDVANSEKFEVLEPHVRSWVDGRICVAHNAQFERSFLDSHLSVDQEWICTWKCALVLWPDAPSHSNEALRYWLALGNDRGRKATQMAHSAGHDVKVTSLLLERILDLMTIETALHVSAHLAQLPTCPIGKHKGEKWDVVPLDYLKWLAFKAQDMRPDVVQLAKNEIDRRLMK